jgi:hypothetical protein
MRSSSASVQGEEVAGKPAEAGLGGHARRTMIYAYPTFHRVIDSALWSPPSNAAKMAGA